MYIGRFAPSSTGSLHLGSLFTALASFLDARANQGKWLLRIDDSDTFRNVLDSTQNILDTLKIFGLEWDDAIAYQSESIKTYNDIVEQLLKQKQVYPCTCTRKKLALNTSVIYPQLCLHKTINKDQLFALRIKSQATTVNFNDQLQGLYTQNISTDHGDFIIKRKDKIVAYQLAVVIDDHLQNITHIVRGYDLLDSTPKQIFLQKLLSYRTPNYCHLPVITDQYGIKLSKQSFAQAIPHSNPEKTLVLLLTLLNQYPPKTLENSTVQKIIEWAIINWRPDALKKIRAIVDNID